MQRRTILVLATLAGLLAMTIPATGSHPQADVTFDHDGGNEWWVELQMGGDTRHDAVFVRDTGGAWKQMTKPSWAPNSQFYAVSYHVEPGNLVQFKATNRYDEVVSCWFTHPAGAERCDGSETGGVTFVVSGDGERIQVRATSSDWAIEEVHWRVVSEHFNHYGGELPLREDGSYARFGTVPAGVILRFMAVGPSPSSPSADSACHRWPTVTPVPCPVPSFPGWVTNPHHGDDPSILYAEAYGDPAKVEVRFDGGPFRAMTHTTHEYPRYEYHGAPSSGEHFAEFRLTGSNGKVQCDEDGYFWPQTTQHDAPMYGTDGRVLITEFKGNSNWLQANAYGVNVVAVQAQVNGGAWQPLTLQSYCDWTKGTSVPAGAQVQFRAFRSDLSVHYSGAMSWPPGDGGTEPQPDSEVFFDHKGGNQWWVEVKVTGDIPPDEVTACDAQGECKRLALKSWGNWAGSFRIDGDVRFRAVAYGGMSDIYDETSCWFTHPGGKTPAGSEVCGGSDDGTTPPPPPPSDFDATFKNVRGNNWWVETDVSASGGTIAGVDARVNGGSWIALTKQSYGSWAKSFHVATGSNVEFRARATDGATDVSTAYRWPPS